MCIDEVQSQNVFKTRQKAIASVRGVDPALKSLQYIINLSKRGVRQNYMLISRADSLDIRRVLVRIIDALLTEVMHFQHFRRTPPLCDVIDFGDGFNLNSRNFAIYLWHGFWNTVPTLCLPTKTFHPAWSVLDKIQYISMIFLQQKSRSAKFLVLIYSHQAT